MNHDQMGHGSMGMGSGGMAKRMVMNNGEYSNELFIDAMVPHHQGAIAMTRVAFKSAEHEEIKALPEHRFDPAVRDRRAQVHHEREVWHFERVDGDELRADAGNGRDDGPATVGGPRSLRQAFIDAMIPHHRSAKEMAEWPTRRVRTHA